MKRIGNVAVLISNRVSICRTGKRVASPQLKGVEYSPLHLAPDVFYARTSTGELAPIASRFPHDSLKIVSEL